MNHLLYPNLFPYCPTNAGPFQPPGAWKAFPISSPCVLICPTCTPYQPGQPSPSHFASSLKLNICKREILRWLTQSALFRRQQTLHVKGRVWYLVHSQLTKSCSCCSVVPILLSLAAVTQRPRPQLLRLIWAAASPKLHLAGRHHGPFPSEHSSGC